jgi:hypothetical protein
MVLRAARRLAAQPAAEIAIRQPLLYPLSHGAAHPRQGSQFIVLRRMQLCPWKAGSSPSPASQSYNTLNGLGSIVERQYKAPSGPWG